MCRTFEIAKRTADEFSLKKSFTEEELYQEIHKRKGVLRVAPCWIIKRYLDYLEDKEITTYDFSLMKWFNISMLEDKRKKLLAEY